MLTEIKREEDGSITSVKLIPQTESDQNELQVGVRAWESRSVAPAPSYPGYSEPSVPDPSHSQSESTIETSDGSSLTSTTGDMESSGYPKAE